MARIGRFEDFEIYQKATSIAIDIYKMCASGNLKIDYGTRDQMQRAAMSISNNIAEGFEYDNNADFIRFLKYAKGLAGELRNQLYVLKELKMLEDAFYQNKYEELIQLSRQLAAFIKYLKNRQLNNS
ncbi:four helix bundle protein [Adhaeribacter swui]|uniref:Four helix bundle protein n=1 Tax=Adhaeribacter swui TaxID=2086471 RepID=A0A7G7G4R7_9BACT|nr:four helix bundle protein [Adhaeribacter swui]QNF32151.1 four helix bundle protein [Adhaeribacter swui]